METNRVMVGEENDVYELQCVVISDGEIGCAAPCD
jgi:hypothetical protein